MSDGDSARENTEPLAPDRQSTRFASHDEDVIVFRSVDGTLFNIHRRNLQSTTDGPLAEDFPAPPGETVQLTEDSETLEILFAFVYPGVYPSLAKLPFSTLLQIAEAAEKYRVAPAMGMCYQAIHLGGLYKTYTIDVLSFADRHGHKDLLDLAAPHTLNTPISAARNLMPVSLFSAWVEYQDDWYRAFREGCEEIRLRVHHNGTVKECATWSRVVGVVDRRATKGNSGPVFADLDALFDGASQGLSCAGGNIYDSQNVPRSRCYMQLYEWKELFRQKTSAISSLSTFISRS